MMGVLEPVSEAFSEEVPATPPGVRDLEVEDSSEDDLFAETIKEEDTAVFNYNNELSFKNILPLLPSKGNTDSLLGVRNFKDLRSNHSNKQPKYCSGCMEDVKKDLNKLAKVVENYKIERDAARDENEILKKQVEELMTLLKQKEDKKTGDVSVTVSNSKEDIVDVLVRKRNFENARGVFGNNASSQKGNCQDTSKIYGVQSLSISFPKEVIRPVTNSSDLQAGVEAKSRKTVAELRKEFFANEFKSEQKTFTSRNFLEIKPEEKKDFVRSRISIRVKPKQRIAEIISKLASKFGGSKIIPEVPQITMFQRFEKTRTVWYSDLEGDVFA